MSNNRDEKTPGRTTVKGAQSREDRLKAALKQNMARRKAQAKARAAKPDPGKQE